MLITLARRCDATHTLEQHGSRKRHDSGLLLALPSRLPAQSMVDMSKAGNGHQTAGKRSY